MRGLQRAAARRQAAGLSLIELIVAIVLLAILGAGFMAMYAEVTRHNAAGEQAAPMTWVAQGVMEYELLYTEFPGATPPTFNSQPFGPYLASAAITNHGKTAVPTGTYYWYLVTVTVTCASGSCAPMVFASYVYTT